MRRLQLIFLFIFSSFLAPTAWAQERIALIIGNSSYGIEIGRLQNPVNDAMLMSKTLRAKGFEVMEVLDADQRQMKRSIRDFIAKLDRAGPTGVGLFFFAGHGIQTDGTNYLIPVGAQIRDEADMEIEAVAADDILEDMEAAANGVNILVLDACRNNPFSKGFRSLTRGLAYMDAPIGSLVAYSTAPGRTATDGLGANSPYTEALADAIGNTTLPLEDVFKRVRIAVMEKTDEVQVP